MHVKIVKMRVKGVAIERRMLSDRYTINWTGDLVIQDVTDQGLRRPVKVARLIVRGGRDVKAELMEPHIVWASDWRFTLSGFERIGSDDGQVVEYAQSWLCKMDCVPVDLTPDAGLSRGARNESTGKSDLQR